MAKLFFLVSGEHETLPFSELTAILEAEGFKYRIIEKSIQAIRLEAEPKCVEAIASRAALTRVCALEIMKCKADYAEIIRKLSQAPLENFIRPSEEFVVRIKRVAGSAKHLSTMQLERKIGEITLNKVAESKVNLFSPQKIFFGILTQNSFIFGLKLKEIETKSFTQRRPKNKPFFHPSAMPPKLSRCMVNLARPKANDLFLDPFCGTGSLLIEAKLIGCRTIGCDAKRLMINGTRKNMKFYGLEPEGLAVADARKPPFKYANCVATDPPYGRSATTMGLTTKEIVRDSLNALLDVIPRKGHVCMAAPKTVGIGMIGRELGYRHLESHFVYVHRSLTREIAVLERP
ncbi:hypothetical protein DRO54_03545 [Candidatus Bathyarchaeota archaeon]|nr:MAG: hypothetical protein DRO54_03545 [Candidatus Bathyarchaeota archaeon]